MPRPLLLVLAAVVACSKGGVVPDHVDASLAQIDAPTTVDAPLLAVDARPTAIDAKPTAVDAAPLVDAVPTAVDACVPKCSGAICGPDFCGGSCGGCDPDLECSIDRTMCQCPFFMTLTYTFSTPDIDWDKISLITVNAHHIDIDGLEHAQPSGDFLKKDHTGFTYRVNGCRPHLRLSLDYGLADFSTCNFDDLDVPGMSAIVIPMVSPTCEVQ